MISEIWTLEPDGTPGDAKTLVGLGISSAILTRRNQAAATLRLTLDLADATADLDAWAWESRWVLRREGVVVYRGRVATLPRSASAAAESVEIELRDAWWDLDRTPYLEEWRTLTSTETAQRQIPRARLGAGETAAETTAQAVAKILAAAASAGSIVGSSLALPALPLPAMDAANQTCGELLRAVLRWHPGASAAIVSAEAADVLRVVGRDAATILSFPVGGAPVESWSATPRPDLQCDAVHVHYEAQADRWTDAPGDDSTGLVSRRALAVFSDLFPERSVATRRTLTVVLPGDSESDGTPNPPPMPHRVAVKTRTYPVDGETDENAQKWWLDMLGWTSLGLTTDDIRLPSTTVGTTQAHRVRFAWQANDPDDPLHERPSPVNPNSKPVWRPQQVEDIPRQLISGSLAEWMRVEAAELVADVTVGVRKSTVDALDDRAKKIFMAFNPRVGDVLGVPAYLVDREVRFMGTDAVTKVYVDWAGASGTAPQNQAASYARAEAETVIPGLAEALFRERAELPWEGSVVLAEDEARPGHDHLPGSVVALSGGRPEWAGMRAVVQSWTADIGRGRTTVQFGGPEHLSPQDHIELRLAPRRARKDHAEAAQSAPQAPPSETEDEDELLGGGGVYPPTVDPVKELSPIGGAAAEPVPWDLVPADSETYTHELFRPDIFRRTGDLPEIVSISGAVLTPEAGYWLVARVTSLTSPAVSVFLVADAHMERIYHFAGDPPTFSRADLPLWRFYSSDGGSGRVQLADGVWGEKLVPSSALRMVFPLVRVPDTTHWRTVPDLL